MSVLHDSLKRRTAKHHGSQTTYWTTAHKDRPALLFVHGWSCSSALWKYQQQLFETYHCILVDLPGHGLSAAPQGAPYHLEGFARALATVIETESISRVVLIGHSLGGPVSTMFLRLFPNRVAGIFYVDSFFNLPEHHMTILERTNLADMIGDDEGFKEKIYAFFSDKAGSQIRQDVVGTMMATPIHVRVTATTSTYCPHAWHEWEVFDIPAMVLNTPTYAALDAQWKIRLPRLAVEIWEEYGHFIFLEDPDRFNASVMDFLKANALEKDCLR